MQILIIFKYLVFGGYTNWSVWSKCSATCDGGEMTRTRSCTNPAPENGGKTCIEQKLGPTVETAKCREFPCPGK